ncbi:MAG: holo-ACP synthase [Candidatus Alcyoniella australis]|nr:holo-ACP synthase [Candidatus Alcyoniella australis]
MIVGIGTDLVEIGRIRAGLERFGQRFIQRVYTAQETAYCLQYHDSAPHFAARFAAKEAVAKALGVGLSQGVKFTQIEVVSLENGRVSIRLSGAAADLAGQLGIVNWHLSLSHSDLTASAYAIAEGAAS